MLGLQLSQSHLPVLCLLHPAVSFLLFLPLPSPRRGQHPGVRLETQERGKESLPTVECSPLSSASPDHASQALLWCPYRQAYPHSAKHMWLRLFSLGCAHPYPHSAKHTWLRLFSGLCASRPTNAKLSLLSNLTVPNFQCSSSADPRPSEQTACLTHILHPLKPTLKQPSPSV